MTDSSRSFAPAPRNKRLLQNHDTFIQWIQHLLNAFIVVGSLAVLAYWRDGEVQAHYRSMMAFSVMLMIITYHIFGVHRRFSHILGGVRHLARAWGVVIIVLAWVAFLTKTSLDYSRQVVVYWAMVSFFGQAVVFSATYHLHAYHRRKTRGHLPALIIGTGMVASHLARSISNNIWLRDKIIGVIDYGKDAEHTWAVESVPVLGTEKDLHAVVEKYGVKRVYVALPFSMIHLIKEVQDLLIDSHIDLVWAPDIFEFRLLNHSVREVAGVPLLNLNETPLMAGGPAFIKLLMDKVFALIFIIMFSPLLLGIALAVKWSSPGPVIFKQRRDGWDGNKFYVYKFRSMYMHEPDKLVKQATKNDSRITPVGQFIRRTSMDELPQLFNVFEGSMSLVGPRPHAESHNEYYSDKVRTYLARHRIKPGMTGLAQINGLRGETEDVESMTRRVEYDLEYISNWSPILDVKILFMTPFCLLTRSGKAY